MTKKVSVDNFRSDPMFPRIQRVVAEQLAKGNVVAPVGVLIGMGLLRPEHLADWRRGRVAYLEHVINCNLSRLSRLLRILRFHAQIATDFRALQRKKSCANTDHSLRRSNFRDPLLDHLVGNGENVLRHRDGASLDRN